MEKTVTEDLIHEFIDQAKKTFYESRNYKRPVKTLLRRIPVNVRFETRLKTTYGWATLIPRYSRLFLQDRRRYNLSKKTAQFYNGDCYTKDYYPLMVLNQNVMQEESEFNAFDTVSHELAHLLDFYMRGTTSHDITWKNLHLAMGGTGHRLGDGDYEQPNLDPSKDTIKKILHN